MLDSVIEVNKEYYLQTLLEHCKFGTNKNEMKSLITDDFERSSCDESYNESDNKSDNESDNGTDNDEFNDQFVKINIVS